MPLRVKNNRFLKEKKNKERIAWGLAVITDLPAAVPEWVSAQHRSGVGNSRIGTAVHHPLRCGRGSYPNEVTNTS